MQGSWDANILLLADHTVLVECGPMRLFIEGRRNGMPAVDECVRAARRAIDVLEETALDLHLIKRPHKKCHEVLPPTARKMLAAVVAVGDEDLTPMAAVAGAVADEVANHLVAMGVSRVIVNNGGDIAIRLFDEEKTVFGIRPSVDKLDITGRVEINAGMGIGGVCTSGFGGRSFTRGCASAVTVFASTSVVADAAATATANATYIKSPNVIRTPAERLDPNTDLAGIDVTTVIGLLQPYEIDSALLGGVNKAQSLEQSGVITGAIITVGDKTATTKGFDNLLGFCFTAVR